ncbi:RdgB/HAM1 family non-canonical purine NTP pyrophosphatase [Schaalia sp. lx-260]|uniref:RdgB/HAM1 family non-canonical purine NTP pyrophosphatase n=1 Tax=Schaalia sp. lx-260 TaxID=2899082 RepID=UPI001E5AA51D|nr:RdgB/HAM1 family non-canonical purine NTP pyrophosphatase [Schaalia sp. lx-260]MCD4550278.1 RdgB/HAM1 family non-canonical purine NTP pyrophosphatase [Schaalia sp. lx-260]
MTAHADLQANSYEALSGPRLVFATGNTHKISEFHAILEPFLGDIPTGSIACLSDFSVPEPIEDGATFAENALIKARSLCNATGIPAVADDSGLCVKIMGGAPGIFSARWSGHHGDDQANLDLLLAQLCDVPDQLRQASFVCAAALVMPDGNEYVTHGEVHGVIIRKPRGSGGFGYDPIFVPEGFEVTSAELTPEQKNALSHRGRALRSLAPHVVDIFR